MHRDLQFQIRRKSDVDNLIVFPDGHNVVEIIL